MQAISEPMQSAPRFRRWSSKKPPVNSLVQAQIVDTLTSTEDSALSGQCPAAIKSKKR